MNKTCTACYGSGKLVGLGMMKEDCHQCDGKGKIFEDELEELKVLHKDKYDKAIDDLKGLGASDEKAKELFASEFKKQGRPKKS